MLIAIASLLLLSLAPLVPAHFGGGETAVVPAVQAAPRMTFNIEQAVTLSRSPLLQLERGRFSVSGPTEPASERRLSLDGATFRLDTASPDVALAGDNYGPEALSPLMTQLAALGHGKVALRSAFLRVTGVNPPITLGPIDAEVEFGAKGQVVVRGVAIYHGEALVIDALLDGGFDAGPSLGLPSTGSPPPTRSLALVLKGETLGDVRIDGAISGHRGLALSGAMVARLASPAALSRWLGAPVRHASALRNIALSGQARWADGILDLQDARVILDGQRPASGVLRVRYRGGRPIVEGTLAFAALDVSKVGASEEQAASWVSLGATLTRDLPAYLEFDADLRLSAATVLLPNGGKGRGAAAVTIDKGILVAELADAEWNGNKARIHVDADSRALWPTFAVRGRADVLQIQDAFNVLTSYGLLAGPANVVFDLKGRSEPFAAAPPVLTGKIVLGGTASTRSLFDPLKVAERSVPPARQGHPLLQSAPVPLEAVDLRLSLTDRHVVVDQGTFKTAGGTANLSGRIDRSTAALDLRLVRSLGASARARSTLRTTETTADSGDQIFSISGAWQSPLVVRMGNLQP